MNGRASRSVSRGPERGPRHIPAPAGGSLAPRTRLSVAGVSPVCRLAIAPGSSSVPARAPAQLRMTALRESRGPRGTGPVTGVGRALQTTVCAEAPPASSGALPAMSSHAGGGGRAGLCHEGAGPAGHEAPEGLPPAAAPPGTRLRRADQPFSLRCYVFRTPRRFPLTDDARAGHLPHSGRCARATGAHFNRVTQSLLALKSTV